MPPKAKIAAPIDRPLSRAYLREFSGWSTAYPPGLSEPTSLRLMENMQVNRDGSLRIRPGMRYLSYSQAPTDATTDTPPAIVHSASQRNSATATVPLSTSILPGDLILACTNGGIVGSGWTLLASATGHHLSYSADDTVTAELYSRPAVAADALPGATVSGGTGVALLSVLVLRNAAVGDIQTQACELTTPTTQTIPAPAVTGGLERYVFTMIQGGGGQMAVLTAASGMTEVTDTSSVHPTLVLSGTAAIGKTTGNGALSPAWTIFYQGGMSNGSDWPWVSISLAVGSSVLAEGDAVTAGIGSELPLVGTHEPFYLADGTKAYLLAVRELDETVGFRVLVVDVNDSTLYDLEDPLVDFEVLQPREVLNFSAETTYVKYLQIDNKIFALSDNGEPMRVFKVGAHKEAKALAEITRPEWEAEDKLDVVHPVNTWIDGREPTSTRRNRLHNPSFETNGKDWTAGPTTKKSRPQTPPVTPVSGSRVLRLESSPARTNLATSPLHDVPAAGISGWVAEGTGVTLAADSTYLKVQMPATKGLYFARSRMLPGVDGGTRYQVAFDYDMGANVAMKCRVRFFGVNGAQVGKTVTHEITGSGRWASPAMTAPRNAVTMRVLVGGENTLDVATHVRFSKVVICPATETTGMFSGDSGANYFWTGEANRSASVYHPPAEVRITSDKAVMLAKKPVVGSLYVAAGSTVRTATLDLRMFNKDGELLDTATVAAAETAALARLEAGDAVPPNKATRAQLRLTIPNVARGEYHYVDAAMIETGVSVAGTYFDGSTVDTATVQNSWRYGAHESASIQQIYAAGATIPAAATKTVNTLVASGGRAANPYSFGFFYTFNNEVGESAASKITVQRTQRAWSEWAWETPNAASEPSGTGTNNPNKSADQLVAVMPQDVFDEALAQGATSWSLYMFTWSDQDAAPVMALKVAERRLPADALYGERGWLRVTPQQADITDEAPLPTAANRINYSDPSRAGQGLVAADRMILVNDPTAAAVIRWSSNQIGEYTNFTARKGGGYKTLTSGNLYVPAAVKLWQNPQSTDTLTILCLGTDGQSTSYYMAPAQVTSQSDATSFMGFEETTATQGTTSPYGVEVLNNALYHPLDDQLTKSTASNYNITHKSMTDMIANMWSELATKYWIMSSQHDNRLYYLVNNPYGEELEDDCKGNEIWVYDAQAESGTWSRFLVQAHALRKIEFGNRIYMSVIRPDGVYYLDPDYGLDDFVRPADKVVVPVTIDWKFETNTQGANRAHDAWAHLQQASIVLGNFTGQLRYGIKGWDVHGKPVDISKQTQDTEAPPVDELPWDIEDFLLIRRDMKEWQLYGESLPNVASSGQVSLVQYRYAPVSVNVGYEYGSVETFEYSRNVAVGNNTISTNGVPVPAIDTRRP